MYIYIYIYVYIDIDIYIYIHTYMPRVNPKNVSLDTRERFNLK